jgi:histidyl-tRNA synthetase
MRDLMGPEEYVNDYLIETAVRVFRLFNYEPLDSPVMELWETLAAKGGEEVESDTFKFTDKGGREVGLRFDLTVPLGRIVASNPSLPKPFKRYAIGKVWRYDRPQAGRYREFTQADVDIVGSSSTAADSEVVLVALEFFRRVLGKDYVMRINNRKVLKGLTEKAGVPDDLVYECFRSIDKLDKIGRDGVLEELKTRGVSKEQSDFLMDNITLRGRGDSVLEQFRELLNGSEVGVQGVDELSAMAANFEESGVGEIVEFDMSLARGLDYYTGPVFEGTFTGEPRVGSVAGGGRYDNLIEKFGGPPTPATGISLGIGRLIDVMIAEGLGDKLTPALDVFLAPITPSMVRYAARLQSELVKVGFSCETDLMERNLKKLLEVADSKRARFAVIIGERDLGKGEVSVRDMRTKDTRQVKMDGLVKHVQTSLKRQLES